MSRPAGALTLLALMSAAVLAGCLGGDQMGDPSPSATDPGLPDTTSSGMADEQQPALRPVLAMDDCHGVWSYASLSEDMVGAEPLPGWGTSPTGFTSVHVEAFLCGRVSIDRFERGPVGVVLEYYGAPGGPADCRQGDWGSISRLHALRVSDPELAQYFSGLGLQVQVAGLDVTEESMQALIVRRAVISPADGEPAVIESRRPALADGAELSTPRRYLWLNGAGGVSFMDLGVEAFHYSYEPPVTTGTLPEPYIYARTGNQHLIGQGHGFDAATARGPVYQFKDTACTEPL